MIYLASPYSHVNGDINKYHSLTREQKYLLVMQAMAILCHAGAPIYSPIVHCHEIAKIFSLPTDMKFWLDYNHNFIDASTDVYVLMLQGWENSKGVQEEINYAKSKNKPIIFYRFNSDRSSLIQTDHEAL